MSRRPWSWWLAAALVGTAACALGFWLTRLAFDYAALPLSDRDSWASVVSMVIAAAGLLTTIALGVRRNRPHPAPAPRPRPAPLPRLGSPLALRVHRAIPLTGTAPGPLDPDLPEFVERDRGAQVREWMSTAARTGGFLVLVGASSVGKTRLLYETAREILPRFSVLAPDLGDGAQVNAIADSTRLPPLIVWLDELQRFLDGPYLTPGSTPITTTAVRRLLEAPTPVVILGTLWPEYATHLRSTRPDAITGQQSPRYPAVADILDDRRLREINIATFSAAELERAEELAAVDPRLADALSYNDFTVTEVLAGAPDLVRRYEQAPEEQRALLFAAIDAYRLDIRSPLTAAFLCAAARGHLTTVHPDDAWFAPALTELTRSIKGTAPLVPVTTPDRDRVVGYSITDYLLQFAIPDRDECEIPDQVWRTLCEHTTDDGDVWRLGRAAETQGLPHYAEGLYRRLAGSEIAAVVRLATLLADQDRLDEAITLLMAHALRADVVLANLLAHLLGEADRADELRSEITDGNPFAAVELARLLLRHDDTGAALELLARQASGGDLRAAEYLATVLHDRGDLDLLRQRAAAGDRYAADRLANLLAERHEVDQLRLLARAGFAHATDRLVDTLARLDGLDELRAMADAGNGTAAAHLGHLLASRATTELRARAAAGDSYAAAQLARREGGPRTSE